MFVILYASHVIIQHIHFSCKMNYLDLCNGYQNKMNGNANSGFESVEDLTELWQIALFIYHWHKGP
jgi:hypothetical protein